MIHWDKINNASLNKTENTAIAMPSNIDILQNKNK